MELGTRKNLIDGSICSRSCTRGIWISISDLSLNWMPHCSRKGPMPIHAQRIRRYCSVFCLTFIVHQLWMNSGFMFDFLSWYSWTVRSLIKARFTASRLQQHFLFLTFCPVILSKRNETIPLSNATFCRFVLLSFDSSRMKLKFARESDYFQITRFRWFNDKL